MEGTGQGFEFYCSALIGSMSLEWGDFQAVSYVNISSSLLPFEVLLCINWANFFIWEMFKQLLVLVRDVPEIVRSSLSLLPSLFLLLFFFFFFFLKNPSSGTIKGDYRCLSDLHSITLFVHFLSFNETLWSSPI